jgi:hypothetical protein
VVRFDDEQVVGGDVLVRSNLDEVRPGVAPGDERRLDLELAPLGVDDVAPVVPGRDGRPADAPGEVVLHAGP